MAVNKVGLGWPVGERNYDTLRAWRDALINSGQFEEAHCKGDLGTSFVTISGTNFAQGALIRGDVQYTGNNRDSLAFLFAQMQLLRSAPNVEVRDLYIRHTTSSQSALTANAGNTVLRCHIEHTGLPGINNAVAVLQTGAIIRNSVIIGLNTTNNYTLRAAANVLAENCVAINGDNAFFSNFSTSTNRNIFALNSNLSDYNLQNGAAITNSASSDNSGNVTGYTSAEFVNFAAGDYRIKANSPLKNLNIGAFFEPSAANNQLSVNSQAKLPTSAVSLNNVKPVYTVNINSAAKLPTSNVSLQTIAPQYTTTINSVALLPVSNVSLASQVPEYTVNVSSSALLPTSSISLNNLAPDSLITVNSLALLPNSSVTLDAQVPEYLASINSSALLPVSSVSLDTMGAGVFSLNVVSVAPLPNSSVVLDVEALNTISVVSTAPLPTSSVNLYFEYFAIDVSSSSLLPTSSVSLESTIPEYTLSVSSAVPLPTTTVYLINGEIIKHINPKNVIALRYNATTISLKQHNNLLPLKQRNNIITLRN